VVEGTPTVKPAQLRVGKIQRRALIARRQGVTGRARFLLVNGASTDKKRMRFKL